MSDSLISVTAFAVSIVPSRIPGETDVSVRVVNEVHAVHEAGTRGCKIGTNSVSAGGTEFLLSGGSGNAVYMHIAAHALRKLRV